MKKVIGLLFVLMLCMWMLVGCGGGDQSGLLQSSAEPLSPEEITQMLTNPDKYKGRDVNLSGVIFTAPEEDDGITAIQMWTDPKNSSGNVVVYFKMNELNLKSNDYVKIKGTITGSLSGQNALGGKVTAPAIQAEMVEKSTYAEVVAPAKRTIEFDNLSQTQAGYTVSINKVEFADDETRVYVTVANNGKGRLSVYEFNAKCVQGGKQFNSQTNYSADYPQISQDLITGVSSDGVICFPALEMEDCQIVLDAYSSEDTISPYTFDIVI